MRAVLCSAIILALIAFSVSLRAPFLSNLLVGEEGSHAYLVVGPKPVINSTDPSIVWGVTDVFPNSHAYANFVGRMDGKDILVFMARNLMAYELLDKGARQINRMLPLCRDRSMRCLSISSRLPFLVLFELGLLIGLIAVRKSFAFDRPATLVVQLLLVAYLLSAPLLVAASIQPQLDGALGVLIVLSSAALLVSSDSLPPRARLLAGCAAGAVGALVKNEWAISLAASTVFVALVSFAVLLRTPPPARNTAAIRRAFAFCLAVLIGIFLCQFLLFVYEPQAFLAGLSIIRNVAGDARFSIAEALRSNWPLIQPVVIACIGMAGLLAVRPFRYCVERPSVAIVSIWAIAIVAGYVYSGSLGDGFPRHYSPPAMLAALALTLLAGDISFGRIAGIGAAVVLATGIGFNMADSVRSYRHHQALGPGRGQLLDVIQRRYERDADVWRRDGATILESSAIGIYFSDVDWVTSENDLAGSIDMVRRYGANREAKVYVPEPYSSWCRPDLLQYAIGCPDGTAR
jgi:hypothetical protein